MEEMAQLLRETLRQFAKTVVVVTCSHGGRRYAMAATAVSEVALEPPTMLVCVNKQTALHEALTQEIDFCINVLRASHEQVSSACGGRLRGEERFNIGDWSSSSTGIPYLQDAQANIFCRTEQRISSGSHTIFIGTVVNVLRAFSTSPLIYFSGRYRTLRDEGESPASLVFFDGSVLTESSVP